MFIHDELYRQILRVMPIPCVDLVVTDPAGSVLLVKRKNEPARGSWWFPGGRVNHGEKRIDAARRKLLEECGLTAVRLKEAGTFDVMLDDPGAGAISHGISTVFHAQVSDARVKLDPQSEEARWRSPEAWRKESLHPFVRDVLLAFETVP